MALSFPASPTVGQQYTDSNRTWEWNGQTWEAISSADFGTGTLTIPVSSTLPTGEGQIVFDGTTDTLHIGEGVGSVQIAKDADIPQSIVDLGIADGTSGQFLSTDGAGNFTFATPVDLVGANALDELTDVTAAGSTAGQVLTSDGAGNFTFTTIAGGGGATTLDSLTDVTAAGATNGQVLTADGAGNFNFLSIAGGGAETVTSLAYDNSTSMLTYTDEAGSATVLDLTNLLDDTNIITDVNGQTGSVSLSLDNLADVTAAGSTAGQILSSDGAGAYTFIDHYGDTDVATYLNGNLNTDIVPDTDATYNIGTNAAKILAINTRQILREDGQLYVSAGSIDFVTNPYGTTNPFTMDSDGFYPGTSGTDLGKTSNRWLTGWFTTLRSTDVYATTVEANTHKSAGQFRLESGSDFIFAGTRINGTNANSLDIGEPTFPMKGIYTNNIEVYTTLTIPINNTPNTDDGSMTWDGTNNKLYVGDGTTAIEIGAGGGYGDTDVATYLNGNDVTIKPATNATVDIGESGLRYFRTYSQEVHVSDIHAPGNMKLQPSGNLEITSDVLPQTDDLRDLGSSTKQWKELWVKNVNLSGADSFVIPVNTTAQTADGAMTWDGTNNKLYVGDGTTAIEIGAGGSSYTDSDAVAAVVASDLDMGGNRVLFANVYTDLADLPSAGSYHGMFAHVHNEAASYYAHASAWHKLANDADVPAAITDLGITDGTSGQVLTTDGAGNFTFTTVSGGGSVALNDITDVTAAGSTAGQVLASDGAGNYGFTDPTLPSIIDILDVTDGVVGNVLQKTGASTYGFSIFTLGEIDNVNDTATAGQVLTADGAGNFTFTTVAGGGGGGATRDSYAGTTASLADQASGDLDVTGCKTYTLFKISTDVAAWVTLYTDAASRTADTRTYADKGSDPSTDGVIAEVITTGAETVIVAPGVIGFNNEASPTTNIPMRVFNDSGGTATVTVTVDVLTLEA